MRLASALASIVVTQLAAGEASAVCNVDLTPVTFGTVDVMQRNDSTGRVKVTCDQSATFEVGIGPGASGNGREMQGPGNARLGYGLYIDAGRNFPWGDGQAIGQANGGTSSGGTPVELIVYGRVPAQPGALPGSYTDTLVVTLNF